MSEAPRRARERRLRDQEAAETGFTLIELLVVLLIIATLVAIAVPNLSPDPKTANVRARTGQPALHERRPGPDRSLRSHTLVENRGC